MDSKSYFNLLESNRQSREIHSSPISIGIIDTTYTPTVSHIEKHEHSSFPVMHKIDNIGNVVRLLMGINLNMVET